MNTPVSSNAHIKARLLNCFALTPICRLSIRKLVTNHLIFWLILFYTRKEDSDIFEITPSKYLQNNACPPEILLLVTAWNVSVSGVILVRIFPHLDSKRGKSISPYLVRMRENTDQNNSEYGHVPRSEYHRSVFRTLTNIYEWAFLQKLHCVKSVSIRSYSGPYFLSFGLNTDQDNCEYGHFLCSIVEDWKLFNIFAKKASS